jgi:peptidoglycan/xylan/chitin deacetylase (PgdA/CDA1 family)
MFMQRLYLAGALASLALSHPWGAFAQVRTVAVTVDDLPYAGDILSPAAALAAEMVNRALLSAFKARGVPATGFVIEQSVESLGSPAGARILREWTSEGFDLGNHTYSHPDVNDLSPRQIEEEILRGETTLGPLLKEVAKQPLFFRFPFNHTGDTKEKHDRIVAFLAQRGYHLATCTIDNSDYLFNRAYLRMLAKNDHVFAQKVRQEYLSYTSAEIDYYAGLGKQVFGHEPPEVMLLHDNRLNADVIGPLLELLEEKHYKFVSLATAQGDAAYQTPDTYITKYGPMWGYRWAKERQVKVNGSLEPNPPQWIVDYGETGAQRR